MEFGLRRKADADGARRGNFVTRNRPRGFLVPLAALAARCLLQGYQTGLVSESSLVSASLGYRIAGHGLLNQIITCIGIRHIKVPKV